MGQRDRVSGVNMYTLMYLHGITDKILPYRTRNSAQCYVAAWVAGGLGEDGFIYMDGRVPSLFT